jgi:hypothetical protein
MIPMPRAARRVLSLPLWAALVLMAVAWLALLQPLPLRASPIAAEAPASSVPLPPRPAERVWLVGPSQPLAEALAQAADGDVVELLPGEYRERVVIRNRRLTIRGGRGNQAAVVQGGGQPVAARALWTIQGGDVTLQDLEFRGARSADGAGAGVRQEGGRLVLRRCRLFDNEHALVAANDPQAEIVVEGGVFGQAPKVEGGLHHLVTIGRIARFEVSGARFQQGFEGHLLKTRARENLIAYNFIHDGMRGGGSLEVDIAMGGVATVIGNVIGQGADTQNPVVLSYGSEGSAWDVNRLHLAHNTFINHGWTPAWFLRVHRDKLPPGVELVAVNNLLVGGGLFEWTNQGRFEGNHHATRRALADVDTYAFELPPSSSLRGAAADLRALGLQQLRPSAEFEWTEGRKPLDPPADQRKSWSPGAFQK